MGSLAAGTMAFVQYVAGEICHEQLLIGWRDSNEYMVFTPDYDILLEELGTLIIDLDSLRISAGAGTVPAGLAGQPLYPFRTCLAPWVWPGLREGELLVRAERHDRGLALGGDVAGGAGGAERSDKKWFGRRTVRLRCPHLHGRGGPAYDGQFRTDVDN